MPLTKVDCHVYRSPSADPETSGYVLVNPAGRAGDYVALSVRSARDGMGGRVGCRLATDHFVEGVTEAFAGADPAAAGAGFGLAVLEDAFRRANGQVYSFGHKLLAGGRMAASLLGLVVTAGHASVGRAGVGGAYLFRDGTVFPFLEPTDAAGGDVPPGRLVGADARVTVDLSSVPLRPGDVITLLPASLPPAREEELAFLLSEPVVRRHPRPCAELCGRLFHPDDEVPFALLAETGPDVVRLAGGHGTRGE